MRRPWLPVLALLFAAGSAAGAELVKWRPIAEGEAEAKKSGKPVLYFMTAEWCGPCRAMRSEVFSDRKAAALVNSTFVPIEVVDRSREEGRNEPDVERLMRAYRIRGFPTLTVVARPGSNRGYQTAGWGGKSATMEYLSIAKQKLEALEREAHEEEGGR